MHHPFHIQSWQAKTDQDLLEFSGIVQELFYKYLQLHQVRVQKFMDVAFLDFIMYNSGVPYDMGVTQLEHNERNSVTSQNYYSEFLINYGNLVLLQQMCFWGIKPILLY